MTGHRYEWFEVKFNAQGNVVSAEQAKNAKSSWTKTGYVDDATQIVPEIQKSAIDTVLYEGKTLTTPPSLKGSTLYFDGMVNTGIVVANDVKYVYTQMLNNKWTTTCETGFGALKTALDELNKTVSYKCGAVIENGIATVVTVYDNTKGTYTPNGNNPTPHSFVAGTATASTTSNGYFYYTTFSVTKKDFVPTGATLTIPYVIYADDMMVGAGNASGTVKADGTVDVTAVSANLPAFFGKNTKITVEPTGVTTNEVAVRYLDADNNNAEILAASFQSKTDKVTVSTKNAIPFQLKTGKTGNITYEVWQGNTKLVATGSPVAVDSSVAGVMASANYAGDNFVDVKISGLKSAYATYTVKGDDAAKVVNTIGYTTNGFMTAASGTAQAQVSRGTAKAGEPVIVSVELKKDGTAALAVNTAVNVTVNKNGVFWKTVMCKGDGTTIVFTVGNDTVNANVTYTVTKVEDVAAPALTTTKITFEDKNADGALNVGDTFTLTFNEAITAAPTLTASGSNAKFGTPTGVLSTDKMTVTYTLTDGTGTKDADTTLTLGDFTSVATGVKNAGNHTITITPAHTLSDTPAVTAP